MTDSKKPNIIAGKTILPKRESWTNETKRDSWSGELTHDYAEGLTIQDLNSILEVNQKALTIYLEVEQQNKDMIELIGENTLSIKTLQDYNEKFETILATQSKILSLLTESLKAFETMKKNIEDLDRNFFRLMLVLGSAGVGTVIAVIEMLVKK